MALSAIGSTGYLQRITRLQIAETQVQPIRRPTSALHQRDTPHGTCYLSPAPVCCFFLVDGSLIAAIHFFITSRRFIQPYGPPRFSIIKETTSILGKGPRAPVHIHVESRLDELIPALFYERTSKSAATECSICTLNLDFVSHTMLSPKKGSKRRSAARAWGTSGNIPGFTNSVTSLGTSLNHSLTNAGPRGEGGGIEASNRRNRLCEVHPMSGLSSN